MRVAAGEQESTRDNSTRAGLRESESRPKVENRLEEKRVPGLEEAPLTKN